MKCPKCNEEIPDISQFCRECGCEIKKYDQATQIQKAADSENTPKITGVSSAPQCTWANILYFIGALICFGCGIMAFAGFGGYGGIILPMLGGVLGGLLIMAFGKLLEYLNQMLYTLQQIASTNHIEEKTK